MEQLVNILLSNNRLPLGTGKKAFILLDYFFEIMGIFIFPCLVSRIVHKNENARSFLMPKISVRRPQVKNTHYS